MGNALVLKKIRRNIADYGFGVTIGKINSLLLSIVYLKREYRLYKADLSAMPIEQKSSSFEFTLIDPANTAAIAQIEKLEEWLAGRVSKMLANGAQCLVAFDGDIVAGFNIFSFSRIHLPLVHYVRNLKPRQAFSEQITVNRDFRGKGLATAIRREVFRHLKDIGIQTVYGGTNVTNIANLKLSRKVGFREIATIAYVKKLARRSVIVKRYRP